MKAGRHFLLLLWKNWLLQKRKKVLTILELALPLIVASIVLIARQLVNSTYFDAGRQWPSFSVDTLPLGLVPPNVTSRSSSQWRFAYSPDNLVVRRLIEKLGKDLGANSTGKNGTYMCIQFKFK